MRNFQQIAAGVDVLPLLLAVYRQPDLWNANPARTAGGGPFAGTDDIWIRFRDPDELVSRESYAEPFTPFFYPAWYRLPQLRPIVYALIARCEAVQLGAILITRVPPGHSVKPHDDRGRWHAEFFGLKVYIPLMTNPACVSTCGDETCIMREGEGWAFPNTLTHSTVNDGDCDRITLITCMRVE